MPIVTSGLIGYWNAQQGLSGTTWSNIAPGTAGKYNGTLNGGVVKNADNVSLDGVDDYVSIGAIQAADKGTAFEVEMYINAPFNGTGGSFGLFMPFSSMSTGDATCFNFSTSGTSVGMADDAKTFPYTAAKNTLLKVNYSVNVSTKQETLYINDSQVAQEIDPYLVDHLNGVLFGRLSTADSNFSFKGLIYSTKIYNRILTTAERSQNTTNGIAVGLVTSTDATVSGVIATTTADTIVPTVTSQKQVTISSVIASITADALNPSLRTDNTISSVIAVAVADAVNPSVGVSGNANIVTLIADMTADAINPSLSIDNAIQSVVGSAIADVLVPSVGSFTNISIDVVIAIATADGTNPSVDAIQNIVIQAVLADVTTDAFIPNLVAPLSVQITSVIAEVTADALTPSFYQLWKEWSLAPVLFTEKISETDNRWYSSIPLNPVPFIDTSQSVNAKWRDTEKIVNYFK